MLNQFCDLLRLAPAGQVFNPWYEVDLQNDIGDVAPEIRLAQLRTYLEERRGEARFLLLGEALGYQGGHFSGIAMTSERILLGHQASKGILPQMVFQKISPRRTSRVSCKPLGFSEPTATIVWNRLINLGLNPRSFVIWNAFPWHPYNAQKGLLSNRTPTAVEMRSGLKALLTLQNYLNNPSIIAVGKKAAAQLELLGISAEEVRHPANGGAGKFRDQIAKILL